MKSHLDCHDWNSYGAIHPFTPSLNDWCHGKKETESFFWINAHKLIWCRNFDSLPFWGLLILRYVSVRLPYLHVDWPPSPCNFAMSDFFRFHTDLVRRANTNPDVVGDAVHCFLSPGVVVRSMNAVVAGLQWLGKFSFATIRTASRTQSDHFFVVFYEFQANG